MEGVLGLVALIAIVWGYARMLKRGMAARVFKTTLSRERLRTLFQEKVARAGWKIVNDDHLIVAQAGFVLGAEQQIGLIMDDEDHDDDMTYAIVFPQSWIEGHIMPRRSHTLRLRLNSFVKAVQAEDPGVIVGLDMDFQKDADRRPTLWG